METPSKKILPFGLYAKYSDTQPVLIASYDSYTSANKRVANYGYVGFDEHGRLVAWGGTPDGSKRFGVQLDNQYKIAIA